VRGTEETERHATQAPRMVHAVRLRDVYGHWQSQEKGRQISSALMKGEWFRAEGGFLFQSGSLSQGQVQFLLTQRQGAQ